MRMTLITFCHLVFFGTGRSGDFILIPYEEGKKTKHYACGEHLSLGVPPVGVFKGGV